MKYDVTTLRSDIFLYTLIQAFVPLAMFIAAYIVAKAV